jgi:type II secretion system protein C
MRKRLFVLFSFAALMGSTALAGLPSGKTFLVLGVIASNPTKQGVALMKDKASGKTFAVKQGTEFDSGTKLVEVKRKHVEIAINGIRYKINVGDETSNAEFITPTSNRFLANDKGAFEVKGDTVKVTSEYKNFMVRDKLDTVLMQAASVPFLKDGKLAGFTLWDIEPNSLFEKFGLKDGDTVTAINEQEIKDLTSTLKLLTSLKGEAKASFRFIRDGSEKSLNIEVQ